MNNRVIISEVLGKKEIGISSTIIESVEKAISKIRIIGTESWEKGSSYNVKFRNTIKEIEKKKEVTPKYFYTIDDYGKENWVQIEVCL